MHFGLEKNLVEEELAGIETYNKHAESLDRLFSASKSWLLSTAQGIFRHLKHDP